MSSLRLAGFLFAAAVVAFLVAFFAGRLPFTPNPDGMSAIETSVQPVLHDQNYNPELLVPESTMDQGLTKRSDNPVATIPESTMGQEPLQSLTGWGDNPVATIPESTMKQSASQDNNYIVPESTMGE